VQWQWIMCWSCRTCCARLSESPERRSAFIPREVTRVSPEREVTRPCVGLCIGAGVAAVDHVLVLPDVCARRVYVAKEEGRSGVGGCSGMCHRRGRGRGCSMWRCSHGHMFEEGKGTTCRRQRIPGVAVNWSTTSCLRGRLLANNPCHSVCRACVESDGMRVAAHVGIH
jgi:hypothetical protein